MVEPVFTLETEKESPGYGLFSLEPLVQGYGQTLGNSIRRVLLTSLPGSAITSVKIDGVRHQFSTVPGLKEDVVGLILNIKKVRLVIEGDEPITMSLSKKGPGEIVAGDFDAPAGVTIVNPDLVLGTLSDKKANVVMEVSATKGMGYLSAYEQGIDEIAR
jgi:DNA-directed RNA polymerase subunit alpha